MLKSDTVVAKKLPPWELVGRRVKGSGYSDQVSSVNNTHPLAENGITS